MTNNNFSTNLWYGISSPLDFFEIKTGGTAKSCPSGTENRTSGLLPKADVFLDDLEKISCPLCGGREFSFFRDIFYRKHKTGRMFKMVKCRNCGLVYLNPRVKKEFIKAYYPGDYYRVNISDPEEVLKTSYEKEKLVLMKKFSLMDNKEKSLLDIGCGKGEFLENLKRYGWKNLRGVEFDRDCVEFAKERYNLDIFGGEFENYPEDESFDVVTFWHSLEHFNDVNSVIKKSTKLLRQNGTIVISVPNIKSLQAMVMGRYWYHIDTPRHTVCFDRHTLQRLLGKHNFIIKNYSYKYPSHNLDGWYNSFLNMEGDFRGIIAKTDRVYQQAYVRKRLHSAKLILLQILKECMGILSYAEMTVGSGGTITIAARKFRK